jgi:hypothetical protein
MPVLAEVFEGREGWLSAIGSALSAISWRVVAPPALLAAIGDPPGRQQVLDRPAEGAIWNLPANALMNLLRRTAWVAQDVLFD